jgi:uncharacterized membrane protein YccC
MPDTRDGREEQAHHAERRQRQRELAEALARGDEPEPDPDLEAVDTDDLAAVESDLDALSFPASGEAVVERVGDRELTTTERTYTVGDLISDSGRVRFESPQSIRTRLARPTVAAALRRITQAVGTVEALSDREIDERLVAYERTFRELVAVAPENYEDAIQVVTEWVLDVVRGDERVPSSRAVRRRAAVYCRANGYEFGEDSWLSV